MSGFRAGSKTNVSLGPGHKKTWPQWTSTHQCTMKVRLTLKTRYPPDTGFHGPFALGYISILHKGNLFQVLVTSSGFESTLLAIFFTQTPFITIQISPMIFLTSRLFCKIKSYLKRVVSLCNKNMQVTELFYCKYTWRTSEWTSTHKHTTMDG
jgi:hypothetical protein